MEGQTREKIVVPYHVAIIPDGNRRWARQNRLILLKSYGVGIKKFIDVSIWAKELGVKVITVWALSIENITQRSRSELSVLYRLYEKTAKSKRIQSLLLKNNARVNVIGKAELLPKSLWSALKGLEALTSKCNSLTINLLIGYSGKEDLAYAVSKLANTSNNISYDAIKENLLSSSVPDIDLIIRTSGEMRLSGFMPWQASYSELYFSKVYWPEFSKDDLVNAISSFSARERRFGK